VGLTRVRETKMYLEEVEYKQTVDEIEIDLGEIDQTGNMGFNL